MDIYKQKLNEIPESKYKELLIILAHRRSPDGAISRKELAYRLNMDDRSVRELITRARKSRFPIIINHNDGGYYLSNNIEEIQAFREREIKSRIVSLNELDQGMKGAIENIWNENKQQITIDDFKEE